MNRINKENITDVVSRLYEKKYGQSAPASFVENWSKVPETEIHLSLIKLFESWNFTPSDQSKFIDNFFNKPNVKEPTNFFQAFFQRPPIVFPIIAIFLLLFTILDAVTWIGNDSVLKINWWKPLPLALYTLFWFAATLYKRWGATAFVVFSILHLAAVIFLKDYQIVGRILDNFMVNPVPLSLIFSFILLIYFRKLK